MSKPIISSEGFLDVLTSKEAKLGAVGTVALGMLGLKLKGILASKVGSNTLSKAAWGAKAALAAQKDANLISYSQPARVEPILLLDDRAAYIPFVGDAVHTLTSLFTAYYLQSIALDTTVSDVKVIKRLDKFNPDRDLAEATRSFFGLESYSPESYQFGLPMPGQPMGVENYGVNPVDYTASLEARDQDDKSSLATRDVSKMITDVSNLAVGKVIEVSISENNQQAKIPVTIRCRVTSMPSDVVVETLAVGGEDTSARARWRKFRANELSFWSDIVLATDRIDAHRRALKKDNSGFYNAVYNRANKNAAAAVLSGGPSVGTASSIIVITEQTRQELERRIGNKLADYETRQGIFVNTFSILIAVLDPEWEEVTIYHRGIEMPTKIKASQMSTAAKGTGPDVAEILKAYQLGSAPRTL